MVIAPPPLSPCHPFCPLYPEWSFLIHSRFDPLLALTLMLRQSSKYFSHFLDTSEMSPWISFSHFPASYLLTYSTATLPTQLYWHVRCFLLLHMNSFWLEYSPILSLSTCSDWFQPALSLTAFWRWMLLLPGHLSVPQSLDSVFCCIFAEKLYVYICMHCVLVLSFTLLYELLKIKNIFSFNTL